VADGCKLVEQAGSTMDEIVVSVRRVSDIMGEISAASQDQNAGIDQINQAMGQMDQVTQQNAALVEEAAAAAQSLEQQARQMVEVVSVFRLQSANLATPLLT
jgi:methyl-accepting chemotaxis protein